MAQKKEIKTISDYIARIEEKLSEIGSEKTVVFRGEIEEFEKPCCPNLFRKRILEENPFFEKNQFDEMTANHLTEGENYLEKAIDAQHGGFPSRLLDVTYNCLVALYFAITPFYHNPENSTDNSDKDGMVYLFPMDKMYCPTGNNIVRTYNMIMDREEQWLYREPVFQRNHKLIDHIKLNTRIVAQQGAFILFQGDEATEIPEYSYREIHIKSRNKKGLRDELRKLCGIHTGTIYPEKYNLVDEIIRKADSVNAKEFSLQSELELTALNLEKCVEYYLKKLEEEPEEKYMDVLWKAENELKGYREDIMSLKRNEYSAVEGYKESVKWIQDEFIRQVEEFYNELNDFRPDGVEFSEEELTSFETDEAEASE